MSADKLCLKLTEEETVQLYFFLIRHRQILDDELLSEPSQGKQNELTVIKQLIHKVFALIRPEPDLSDLEKLFHKQ